MNPLGRWILTLAMVTVISGCRRDDDQREAARGRAPDPGRWFTDITNDVGLDFVYQAGPYRLYLPEIMGSGVALMDFDNDGDLDIYLTNGHNGLPGIYGDDGVTNRYFRQEADGRFVDATAESGLGDVGYGMGVAVADIDNDGDRDVYVTNLGPDRLYRNRGDGTFEDITEEAGISVDGWSCSAAFFDYDRDGLLDLFVTQYVTPNPGTKCTDNAGRPDYCSPGSYQPIHDVLLHNEGGGRFKDVSEVAGMKSVNAGAGLGVVCEDLNDDGWIDIYVANDGDANHLWLNQRDGTFRDDAVIYGAAYNVHGNTEAGMGVVAADFDNDLDLDLFLTHLNRESNTLYRNAGSGMGFLDVTGECGLGASSMVHTGFGTAAFDGDLDGDLDLVIVNGRVASHTSIYPSEVEHPWGLYAEPNLFYLNDGTGKFTSIQESVEPLCGRVETSRGLAVGDVDMDGDLDVLVTNIQSPARLYRNDFPRKGHWLMIRAVDPALHRDAIGAKVTVFCSDRSFFRTIPSAFSYLSSSEPVAHFGLGSVEQVERIEIRWPDGLLERFGGEKTDQFVKLVRGTGQPLP